MHKMALNLSRQETLSVFGCNGGGQVQLLSHARGLNRNDDLEDKENKASDLGKEQELNRTGKRPAYQPLDGFETDEDPAGTLGHLMDRPQNITATTAVGAASAAATSGARGVMTRSRAKKQKILEDDDIQELRIFQANSATPSPSSTILSDNSEARESTLSPTPSTCTDYSKGQGSSPSIFRVKEAATYPPYAKEPYSEGPSSRDAGSHPEPTSPKVYDLTVPNPPHSEESRTRISSSSDPKDDQVSSSAGIYTLVNLIEPERPKQRASSGILLVGDLNEVPARGTAQDIENVERASEERVSVLQTREGHGAATNGVSKGKSLKPTAERTTTPLLDEKALDLDGTSSLATATTTPLVSDIALKSSGILDDASDVASNLEFSDTEAPVKCPTRLTTSSATGFIMPTVVDTDDETVDMDISDNSDNETADMNISDTDSPTIGPTKVTTADTQQTTDLDPEESESDDVDDLFVVEAGPSKPWKGLKRLKVFTDEAYKGKRKARALLRKVNRLAAESTDKKIEAWAALGFAAPTPEQKKKPLGHVVLAKSDANGPSWDEWWVLPFSP